MMFLWPGKGISKMSPRALQSENLMRMWKHINRILKSMGLLQHSLVKIAAVQATYDYVEQWFNGCLCDIVFCSYLALLYFIHWVFITYIINLKWLPSACCHIWKVNKWVEVLPDCQDAKEHLSSLNLHLHLCDYNIHKSI